MLNSWFEFTSCEYSSPGVSSSAPLCFVFLFVSQAQNGVLQNRLKASFHQAESPWQPMLEQVMFRVLFKICESFLTPQEKKRFISDVYIYKSSHGEMYLFFSNGENNLPLETH